MTTHGPAAFAKQHGLKFGNPQLLKTAFVHSSYVNELGASRVISLQLQGEKIVRQNEGGNAPPTDGGDAGGDAGGGDADVAAIEELVKM